MRFVFRVIFFVVLIAWIVWSKDALLPHFQAAFGELPGYIANGVTVFVGGWLMWRFVSRGRIL